MQVVSVASFLRREPTVAGFASAHFFIAGPDGVSGSERWVPSGNAVLSSGGRRLVSSAVDGELVQSCFINPLLLYVCLDGHHHLG